MKKTNPRRKPATQADVERAKKQAQTEAVSYAMAIFFTVLFDKHNATPEELQVFWKEVTELSDSISKGYVNISDLRHVLREEYGIDI